MRKAAPSARTTTTLDLMLQNGLEITAEGTCTRHPGVVLCSKEKGGVSSCGSCDQEQKYEEGGQQKQSLPPVRGQGLEDAELNVSLSKIVSGLPETPTTVASSSDPGGTTSNNRNQGCKSNINFNSLNPQSDDEDDGEDGNLEALIARWCQLQGASANGGKPSNDMLSTTLVLLQLQKLERRILHQERSMQQLQHNMQEQQSAIQFDLTQILSCVTAPSSNPTASAAYGGNRSRPQQHSQSVPQSQRSLDSHLQQQNIRESSLQFSGVFNSVRTLEKQPPKPPMRHDSFQSLINRTNGTESSSVQGSISSRSNMHVNPPPPPPPVTHTTANPSVLSPSMTLKKVPTNGTSTSSKARNPLGGKGRPHPLKPKTSFRNLPGPQLDIIWDASEHNNSEHTQVQATGSNSGNNTPGSRNGMFQGKSALPKLSSTLGDGDGNDDDDDNGDNNDEREEDDDLSSHLKVFSGMQNYNHNKPIGAGLHDSIMTSAFQSFGEDSSFSEADNDDLGDHTELTESEYGEADDIALLFDEKKATKKEKKEMKKEKKELKKEMKKEKKEMKKEMKLIKKESKKSDKKKGDNSSEFSTGSTTLSGQNSGSFNVANSKLSPVSHPMDEKPRSRGRFSKAKNIIWKRSLSKPKDISKREKSLPPRVLSLPSRVNSRPSRAHSLPGGNNFPERKSPFPRQSSPIPPQRQNSVAEKNIEDDSVADDDSPRTEDDIQLRPSGGSEDIQVQPIGDSRDIQVQSNSGSADIQVHPIHVDISFDANGEIATAEEKNDSGDCPDDITTKTPMSAKTPYSAIVASAAPLEPPPPPQPQQHRQEQIRRIQRQRAAEEKDQHPPSPPPRQRQQFPRTKAMLPKLLNSKRDMVIGTGESARMQISTLTLDTALPSADAGSVLMEVNNQSLTDKCKERGSYTGTISEADEPDGYGTMIYNNGAFYKGQWKEGHWHGEGILRTPNGDSYEGDFVYDCRHGRGIYKYENGDVYEGDFSTDKRNGKGTFLFQNGSMYRGDFAYGNFHGYGWYEFEAGYYEGLWLDGNYEGIGTLTYKDGSHYTGRFKCGVADGLGEERRADGTGRRGMWKNGEFEGQERDQSSAVLSI